LAEDGGLDEARLKLEELKARLKLEVRLEPPPDDAELSPSLKEQLTSRSVG
jgi:hypothetical protein